MRNIWRESRAAIQIARLFCHLSVVYSVLSYKIHPISSSSTPIICLCGLLPIIYLLELGAICLLPCETRTDSRALGSFVVRPPSHLLCAPSYISCSVTDACMQAHMASNTFCLVGAVHLCCVDVFFPRETASGRTRVRVQPHGCPAPDPHGKNPQLTRHPRWNSNGENSPSHLKRNHTSASNPPGSLLRRLSHRLDSQRNSAAAQAITICYIMLQYTTTFTVLHVYYAISYYVILYHTMLY